MQGPKLKEYYPTVREKVEGGIYDIGGLLGADPRSTLMRNIAGTAGGILDFVPGLGDIVGAEETYRDYKDGNYVNAGLGAAATVAGLIPVVGDVAGKAIKTFKKDPMVVQHNRSPDVLYQNLLDDGLPAPSMAVVKVDDPMDNFGRTYLFGDKKLAIPSADNPVFKRDAYTPREPRAFLMMPDKMQDWSRDRFGSRPAPDMIEPNGTNSEYLWSDVLSEADMKKAKENGETFREYYLREAKSAGFAPRRMLQVEVGDDLEWVDATPENVVKEMLDTPLWAGAENQSTNSLIASSAGEFKDFEELSNARGLLGMNDSFDEVEDQIFGLYNSFSDDMQRQLGNIESWQVDDIIRDYAAKGELPPEVAKKLSMKVRRDMDRYTNLVGQLPTQYFEIKPKRVIKPSEFKMAIIPESKAGLLEVPLLDNGVKVEKYDDQASFAASHRLDTSKITEILKKYPELQFAVPGAVGTGLLLQSEEEEQKNAY